MYQIYLKELRDRVLYLLLNLCLCLHVYQNYLHILILLKAWSVLTLLKYKFIILHILELVYINLLVVLYTSILTLYPFFLMQSYNYLKNSLYNYQSQLLIKFYQLCTKSIIYSTVSYCVIGIPVINFLLIDTQLYHKLTGLVNINIELQLIVYVTSFTKLYYIFMYIIIYMTLIITIVHYFTNINTIYKIFKYYKKLLLIFFLCIMFIMLPSNISIQPFIIIITVLVLEIIFIYINYKFSLIYKWVL